MNEAKDLKDYVSEIIAAVEGMDFCEATDFAAKCWENMHQPGATRSPEDVAKENAELWAFLPYGRKVMRGGIDPKAPKDIVAAFTRFCDLFDVLIAKFNVRDRRALKYVRRNLVVYGNPDGFRSAVSMGCAFASETGPLAGFAKLREDYVSHDTLLVNFDKDFDSLVSLAAKADAVKLLEGTKALVAKGDFALAFIKSLESDFSRIFGKANPKIAENREQLTLTLMDMHRGIERIERSIGQK